MRTLAIGAMLAVVISAPALACGPGGTTRGATPIHLPPIAMGIDRSLPDAALPETDLARVKALRARIDEAVKAENDELARKLEEEAMAILGYRKMWIACGPGTFFWMKFG